MLFAAGLSSSFACARDRARREEGGKYTCAVSQFPKDAARRSESNVRAAMWCARAAPTPPRPRARRAPRSPAVAGAWGGGGACQPRSLHALSRLSKWRISRSYITFIDTIINISYTLISLSSLKISAADISTFHTHITLWLAHASHHIGRKSPPYAWHERDRERARARDAVNDSTRGLDGTSRATNRGRPGHGAPGARQGIARSIVLRAHGAARPHCIGTAVATGM